MGGRASGIINEGRGVVVSGPASWRHLIKIGDIGPPDDRVSILNYALMATRANRIGQAYPRSLQVWSSIVTANRRAPWTEWMKGNILRWGRERERIDIKFWERRNWRKRNQRDD